MTIKEIENNLVEEFKNINDWDEKYSKIIKLGRELEEFPTEFRNDKNKIDGCQSQVWMHAKLEGNKIKFWADSDAMIVKGLAALILKVYSNQTIDDIINTPPNFISEIGIDGHLSPTRKNGLGAMLKQIKMYALAFKALKK